MTAVPEAPAQVDTALEDYLPAVDLDAVMSEEAAAQMMHVLLAHRRRIARKERVASATLEAEQARVAEWLERETSGVRAMAQQIEDRLSEWVLHQRDVYNRMSVSFPHGKVSTREAGGGWEVTDQRALLAWAKANAPALVKVQTTERFSVEDARRATSGLRVAVDEVVDSNGEIVPGLRVQPKEIRVKVETGTGGAGA